MSNKCLLGVDLGFELEVYIDAGICLNLNIEAFRSRGRGTGRSRGRDRGRGRDRRVGDLGSS